MQALRKVVKVELGRRMERNARMGQPEVAFGRAFEGQG